MKPLLLCLILLPATALSWDNNVLDQAWRQANATPLMQAAERSDDFQSSYANYRLAMLALRQDDKKQAKQALDALQDALENYQSCDEAALYGASIGLSITLKPWQAAFIAGRANDALDFCDQPERHAPTLMVDGVGLYNTPSLLGGDRDAALEAFNRALELYAEQDAWGHEDAWLWKVRALQALERPDEARQVWETARQRYPDFVELREIAP